MDKNSASPTSSTKKKILVVNPTKSDSTAAPKGIEGATKKAPKVLSLEELGSIAEQFPSTPPPTPKEPKKIEVATKSNIGYVLESGTRDGKSIEWTKVLIKTSSGWTTGIIERPDVLLNVGTAITYKLTPKQGNKQRPALILSEIVVVEDTTIVSDLYRFLLNPDNHSTSRLKLVYLSDLSNALVQALPLKTGLKEFLQDQGIDYIVGQLSANQFIVKLL